VSAAASGPPDEAGQPLQSEAAPGWLISLAGAARQLPVPPGMLPPPAGGRRAAVLILFADGPEGPDVLLVQRSAGLRRHPGQPAFPGGAIDPGDSGPVAAAVREAAEEARVEPASVAVLAVLPDLFISRSGFVVSPVLAWWRSPGPVGPGDPGEIAAVRRVAVGDLARAENRLTIRYPSGHAGPAFRAAGMLIWGFTAMVIDRLLAIGGWEQPWDSGRVTDLPAGELTIDGWPAAAGPALG